jgi:tetratricopeptide (TPR) repeat protein
VELPPPEGLVTADAASAAVDSELLLDPLAPPAHAEPLPGLEHTAELEMDDQGTMAIDPSLDLEHTQLAELAREGAPLEGIEEHGDIDIAATDGLLDTQDDMVLSLSATETDLSAGDEATDAIDLDFIDPVATEPAAGLPLIPLEDSSSLAELENRVLDDPDNPELHRQLGHRLLGQGDIARAEEELLLALAGFEQREDWRNAGAMADHLVALVPDEIGHHQKRVELAFRTGDREPLLVAYQSLGDALARLGATEKAEAVFRRVQEHDPGNARAEAALAALSTPRPREAPRPVAAPARPAGAAFAPPPPAAPAPTASAPPPAPPPAAPAADASFVDFGSLVLDEGGQRDTRMRIDRREPQDEDEQREFREILEQFKRGIEQNLDTEDYQAHYDLGIAFKEMGLLDEAIAEFQKALRAPEGRLRTSEALGISFFDKGQYAIAETVLRRAVETLEGGDEAKIGLLYWLGRAAEAQGKGGEAIASYERALAVDIRFMDLGSRVQRLTAERGS